MRAAGIATLAPLLLLASGCNEGTVATPTFDAVEGGPTLDATVGEAGPSYAVCPDGMDATFGSIYTLMLSTPSAQTGCGTGSTTTCHSTVGSNAEHAGSLLDFSLEAGAVYAELLGADGGGMKATNVDDLSNHVLRVVPFDAGSSMLYIKLTLDGSVPEDGGPLIYGVGMPYNDPGSVCPQAVQAVADWINAGAPQFPVLDAGGDGGTDAGGDGAGDAADSGGDAGADGG